jgi:hypothetical protein
VGHGDVDVAFGLDLGVVADATEQAVGDPWGAAGASGDLDRPAVVDLDAEEPGGAADDGLELLGVVVLELGGEPEPVAER